MHDTSSDDGSLQALIALARAIGVKEIRVDSKPSASAIEVIHGALEVLLNRRIPPPEEILLTDLVDPETIATYRDSDDQLVINIGSGFWQEPRLGMNTWVSGGYLVSNDPRAINYHEVGHARHRRQFRFGFWWWIAASRQLRSKDRRIAERVSRYAAEDAGEFVAEVFAGILSGREFDDSVLALYRKLKGPNT